jgi:hypothetical protein
MTDINTTADDQNDDEQPDSLTGVIQPPEPGTDTDTGPDGDERTNEDGVIPDETPGLPTSDPGTVTVPPAAAALVPDGVDEGDDLAGQVVASQRAAATAKLDDGDA